MDLALAFEDSQPFKLTVEQYRALDASGAFDESSRVELIEGMIVCMSPMSVSHAHVAGELYARLRERLLAIGSPLIAYPGVTVEMPPHSAPDPDIVVGAQRSGRDYLPVAAARLLVEVSRTTLRKDMTVKRDIYAAAGVPEYRVVDVNRAEVHRYAEPVDGAYRQAPPVSLAGELQSLTLPELRIDGSGIL